jgi:hypothetical protein
MDTILTKEQVNLLTKDITIELEKEVDKLFTDKIESLLGERDKFIKEQLTPYEELLVAYNKIAKAHEQYTTKYQAIGDNALPGWRYNFGISSGFTIEEVKESLIDRFNSTNHLSNFQKECFLRDIVIVKVKAILCTLTGTAYEDIIKVVHEKLNLNDLFDNRQ